MISSAPSDWPMSHASNSDLFKEEKLYISSQAWQSSCVLSTIYSIACDRLPVIHKPAVINTVVVSYVIILVHVHICVYSYSIIQQSYIIILCMDIVPVGMHVHVCHSLMCMCNT